MASSSFAGLDHVKKLRGRAFSSTRDKHLFGKGEGTGKYVHLIPNRRHKRNTGIIMRGAIAVFR